MKGLQIEIYMSNLLVDEIKETRMLWWEISSFVEVMENHVHYEALHYQTTLPTIHSY
jgi:hypothetical protein